jgi:hypothetical protein
MGASVARRIVRTGRTRARVGPYNGFMTGALRHTRTRPEAWQALLAPFGCAAHGARR